MTELKQKNRGQQSGGNNTRQDSSLTTERSFEFRRLGTRTLHHRDTDKANHLGIFSVTLCSVVKRFFCLSSLRYLPTTRTTKLSGKIVRRGCGFSVVAAGGGTNFAVTTNTLWVFESSARVRAPGSVLTLSATLNLSGDSSRTTVSTPSPQEANASPVSSSNAVASTPSPIAGVASTLPVSASTTAIILLSQPANRRRFLRSMASPLGSSHGARGQRDFTSSLLGSIASSWLLSSMLTKISPLPSLTANSGLPSSLIVPSTMPLAASIAVES